MMGEFDFVRVYEPGIQAKTRLYGLATLWCRTVGELVVPSGRLVARDEGFFENVTPLEEKVPPGRYPVVLAFAHLDRTADERVVSAMLRLSEAEPVRWEWAKLLGEEAGKVYSICVDSGACCFMDKEAADLLLAWKDQDEQDLYTFLNEESRYSGGGSEWVLNHSTGLNMFGFSSGWGDGSYACCWGYDANDSPVCLAINFYVLEGATFIE